MKTLLLFGFFCFSFATWACSCHPYYSFCEASTMYSNDVTILGQIIDTNQLNIRIKRSKTLRGIESRDTITVWNDTNFNCNGVISMKASRIGNPGDSIIIHLPRIDSIVNPWDEVGDYRRPAYLCIQTTLHIQNDTVRGLVNQTVDQSVIPPIYTFYSNFALDEFVAFTEAFNGDCISIRDSSFDYIPFPESNVRWKESGLDAHQYPSCFEEEYLYTLDTLINGKTYHKLQSNSIGGNSIGGYCFSPYINWSGELYYRNDVVNRRVYFIDSLTQGSIQEKLAYDFNLQVGDTLPISLIATSTLPSDRFVIDSINYVYEAGRIRRRYLFYAQYFNRYESITEGIGSSAGLIKDLNDLSGLCCGTYLDCISIDGIAYPLQGAYASCTIITSIDNHDLPSEDIQLYPNPSTGKIYIQTDKQLHNIELFSLQGKLIQEWSGNKHELVLPEKSGMYLIRFQLIDGSIFHTRVIKK